MKKYKCIATAKDADKKSSVYVSHTFSVVAKSFKEALLKAHDKAKKMVNFESLKVNEL